MKTKIRKIIEKYTTRVDENYQMCEPCIELENFDKLEKELEEYIDYEIWKGYSSHDVDEFYKEK